LPYQSAAIVKSVPSEEAQQIYDRALSSSDRQAVEALHLYSIFQSGLRIETEGLTRQSLSLRHTEPASSNDWLKTNLLDFREETQVA
jgi:hypothetical protein